jgi:hypothetical protein
MYQELPRSFFSSSSVKTNYSGTLFSLGFSSTIFVGATTTYFSKKVSDSSGRESLNTTIPIFLLGSTGWYLSPIYSINLLCLSVTLVGLLRITDVYYF